MRGSSVSRTGRQTVRKTVDVDVAVAEASQDRKQKVGPYVAMAIIN